MDEKLFEKLKATKIRGLNRLAGRCEVAPVAGFQALQGLCVFGRWVSNHRSVALQTAS